MKIKEITQFLEGIAPLNYQESYDNSGLIVGNENKEVTSVLICLDSVEEVIDEAIENGCNLVITHHPIVFSGLKKLNGKNHIERTIIKAIKNDIAIYAIHTNLDNVEGGVSSKIANKLGLKNQKILSPKRGLLRKLEVYVPKENAGEVQNALFSSGAGSIGDYKNCSFQSEGIGTFLPTENANPTFGENGKQERVEEVKIEVIFPKNIEKRIISEMKKAHPYEEVSHQIYILDNVFQDIGSGIVGELENEMNSEEFLKSAVIKISAPTNFELFNKKLPLPPHTDTFFIVFFTNFVCRTQSVFITLFTDFKNSSEFISFSSSPTIPDPIS
ncbi:MAG: Nif3-like dinuclear metal center hexameric protein [Flavobacteriales bacterium]|nr:Nif3-like dinuclear metal center hexameric protein [Flavobacteriales bacterium]